MKTSSFVIMFTLLLAETLFPLHSVAAKIPVKIQEIQEALTIQKSTYKGADLHGAILNGADLKGADLSSANLMGADLRQAELPYTNLVGANLSIVDLSEAYLGLANLMGAILVDADLSEANLSSANLSMADMGLANLTGAYLEKANMNNADLSFSNMSGAVLKDVSLSNASMHEAILTGVVFEARTGSLPNVVDMARARGLHLMTFDTTPHALYELRQGFKKAGFRKQERQITYAIEHTKTLQPWKDSSSGQERKASRKIGSVFKYVFYELTCLYGLSPWRPMCIIVIFIFVFTLPYMAALVTSDEDGIWKVWAPDRLRKDLGKPPTERITAPPMRAAHLGFYFSILSAFHLGWREFNIGSWIAQVRSREYTLRPTGWVRTVSGIQSLISVYLLALWALTYFGRPFE